MPLVTVWPTPNGIADGQHRSPTCSASESPSTIDRQLVELDLEHRQIGIGVGADHLARARAAVVSVTSISSAPSTTWLLVRM